MRVAQDKWRPQDHDLNPNMVTKLNIVTVPPNYVFSFQNRFECHDRAVAHVELPATGNSRLKAETKCKSAVG